MLITNCIFHFRMEFSVETIHTVECRISCSFSVMLQEYQVSLQTLSHTSLTKTRIWMHLKCSKHFGSLWARLIWHQLTGSETVSIKLMPQFYHRSVRNPQILTIMWHDGMNETPAVWSICINDPISVRNCFLILIWSFLKLKWDFAFRLYFNTYCIF